MSLKGAVGYFREHLKVGDYLVEEGKAEMTWYGQGAQRLGLTGVCDLEDFSRLCLGQHPQTGAKLGVRDKGAHRRLCYFGQISAPKDVSIAYLVGGDARIGGWWEEAISDTLKEMEAVTSTRVRRGGADEDRVTGNMVASVVTHDASRALDPQLHTHVCIMNLTFDPVEQRWKGVQPSLFYRHNSFFREVCHAKLAARMQEAGYELESSRKLGFNIKGFPPELRDKFSKRRTEILRRAAEEGATSQAALQAIVVKTRARKTKATVAELRAGWIEQAGEGLAAVRATIASADGVRRAPPPLTPAEALASAEAHLFERRSVVDGRFLLREALIAGRGGVSLDQIRAEVATRLAQGELLHIEGELASRETLAAENEFVGWAKEQCDACGELGRAGDLAGLGRDQQQAVVELLASPSRITILQGDAGTGKTTCLRSVVAGIESAGGRVFGCAPSAGAADVLRRELTPEANTLQQLLVNQSLQLATFGRVLIVDEAGLISVRQMRDLCRLAYANNNRLLLVGDTKQHTSVEAGDALRCLEEYAQVPVAHLSQIRRQQDPAYREAVGLLARGDAFGAFNAFTRLGAVQEIADEQRLFKAAADDYVQTISSGKSCLAISPVWAEIRTFTTEVRTQLKATGRISGEEKNYATVFSLQWTREECRRVEQYEAGDALTFHRATEGFAKHETVVVARREEERLVVRGDDGRDRSIDPKKIAGFDVGVVREIPVAIGDRLLIRANLKEAHLKNGDTPEVAGFAADGGITLKDGRVVPPNFRQFSHGYATTSHSSQGKTVDRGLLLMAEAGIAAGNLKQAYVSNSRFRFSQMIYTTDRKAAQEAMMRPADRKLATELVDPDPLHRRVFLARAYRLGQPIGAEVLHRGWWGGTPEAAVAAAAPRQMP
ncbi:MAG: MobF family relaxase [Lacunisphaera sp.]|nr:MobF family relaxase [Lacunisphaera sp.]